LEDWLIKYSGGLLDLRNTLLHNNNYYTGDAAIKAYLKLVYFYAKYYEKMYKGHLIPLTYKFINELIKGSYYVEERPFNWHLKIFTDEEELSKKIFVAKRFTASKLDRLIRKYLMSLYTIATDKPYIVLVNSIQNGNLLESMTIFDNVKVITCCRDFRDVYLDFKYNAKGSFIPTDSAQSIKLFFYSLFYKYPIRSRNILNIRFEDFVTNYHKVSKQIMRFVGLKANNHVMFQEKFNPLLSVKNVELWKKYPEDVVVAELGEYSNIFFQKRSKIYRVFMYFLSYIGPTKLIRHRYRNKGKLL